MRPLLFLLICFCSTLSAKDLTLEVHLPNSTAEMPILHFETHSWNKAHDLKSDKDLPLIYPVKTTNSPRQKLKAFWLARSPQKHNWQTVKKIRLNRRDYKIQFIPNSPKFNELKEQWTQKFQEKLLHRIEANQDTEFETALYIHLFNDYPKTNKKSWKKDRFAKFLFTLSGLQDLEDALPKHKKDLKIQQKQKLSLEAPKPLLIPQVQSPATELEAKRTYLASYIPRSCYAVEFPAVKDFIEQKQRLSNFSSQWSPNTYPKNLDQAITDQIAKTGITTDWLTKNQSEIKQLAFAGWDFYIQSGSNTLIILETSEKVKLPKLTHSYSQGNIHLIASSAKALSMAKKAQSEKKSLSDLNNYRYARKKFTSTGEDQEKVFIYVSDYCFTNLLSPRWQISTKRRNELSSKIRFAELLRLIAQKETATPKMSLEQIRQHFKGKAYCQWILQDLVENNNRLSDNKGQSLFNFTPIDEVDFKQVSPEEKAWYKDFTRRYSRLWRQMDPVAFQITEDPKGLIKSKLYISPISNISGYRDLNKVVLKEKKKHQIISENGEVLGLSLLLKTDLIRPFAAGIPIPLSLQLGIKSFDFAPRINSLSTLLKSDLKQDYRSFLRAPAYLQVPELLSQTALQMSRRRTTQSAWPDTEVFWADSGSLFNKAFIKKNQGWSHLAANPNALLNIKKENAKEEFRSTPSDIYFFADLQKGYLLRNFLIYEACKNRTLSAWRRQSRLQRIQETLGLSNISLQGNKKDSWTKRLSDQNIFPEADKKYQNSIRQLPISFGEESPYNYGEWNSSALPEIFNKLQKLELFISVDANSLLFETHWHLPKVITPERDRTPNSPRTGNTTELDF